MWDTLVTNTYKGYILVNLSKSYQSIVPYNNWLYIPGFEMPGRTLGSGCPKGLQ